MPATPLTHRPQTLKQAKIAYRKSGATARLSESEKAVLERRAVLQERADRIKEREARRKANVKRKEERVQREREARHRMGIPTPPAKEGIHIGPSQLHLSDFMYEGERRKRRDGEEDEKSGTPMEGQLVLQEQQTSPLEPPPSRRPLQLLSANATSQRPPPSQTAKANPPKVRDFALQETPVSPKRTPVPSCPPFPWRKSMHEDEVPEPFRGVPVRAQATPEVKKTMGLPTLLPPLCRPPQPKAATSPSQQKTSEKTNSVHPATVKAPRTQTPQASTMGPPPPRRPVPTTTLDPPTPSTSAASKPEAIPEDYLDFFVSNTQIERELSPHPRPPYARTPLTTSITRPLTAPAPAPARTEDPTTLLAQISTQDLDFTPDPTQPPRQDPAPADEDFPDDELESLLLKTPLSPTDHPPLQSASDADSDYGSDDAGLQSALRDHEGERQGQEAAWDAFDLCTQDLVELES